MKLDPHIRKVNDYIICNLTPNIKECKQIDSLAEVLRALDSVTKRFQKEDITLAEVCAILEDVIKKHTSTESRLSPTAKIALNLVFESSIVKIQDGHESKLNLFKLKSVTHLLKSTVHAYDDVQNLPLAEKTMKRRRFLLHDKSKYLDLRFIQPISNCCERFFPIAGYALFDRFLGMLPIYIESQMFLHVNKQFWNIQNVRHIDKMRGGSIKRRGRR